MSEAMMSIGEFARASGLSAKALRLYDEMALVVPREVDPVTGYRRYDAAQLGRARLVAQLRLAGLPLARIRVVADLAPAAAAAELTSYWRQVEADAATARRLVAVLVDDMHRQEQDMTSTPRSTPPSTMSTNHPEPAVRTGIGGRESQEDAVRSGGGLYAVADGVGAVRGVAAVALGALTTPAEDDDALAVLDAGVAAAAAAVAVAYPDQPEAASTLTALVLQAGRASSAHVGDSRLYLVRDGSLARLTRDHTVVQSLVEEGRLTAEEAWSDDRRVVLNRAVAAGSPSAPDLAVHAVRPGDRLVLTTDGVHGRLDAATLAGLLLVDDPAEDVAAAVEEAVLAAGADDNYAVLVVDVP